MGTTFDRAKYTTQFAQQNLEKTGPAVQQQSPPSPAYPTGGSLWPGTFGQALPGGGATTYGGGAYGHYDTTYGGNYGGSGVPTTQASFFPGVFGKQADTQPSSSSAGNNWNQLLVPEVSSFSKWDQPPAHGPSLNQPLPAGGQPTGHPSAKGQHAVKHPSAKGQQTAKPLAKGQHAAQPPAPSDYTWPQGSSHHPGYFTVAREDIPPMPKYPIMPTTSDPQVG